MLFLGAAALTASAQHQGHGGHHPLGRSAAAPYAGFQDRPIKALSQQQIDDLQAGRGMGLALAAELNGYPGPLHVLEHEQALGLTPGQRSRMENLMAQMRADAVRAGEAVVAAERALDRLFADGTASEEALSEAVRTATRAQSEVRFIHLKTHIKVRSELTAEQIAAYNRVRGYAAK
jgi:Spy/CpxP family protein refolding chaperone